MPKAASVKQIERALSLGQLSIKDPETGYLYSFHARCPRDKALSAVYRVNRANEMITEVIFRCPVCREQFQATSAEIVLK